MEYFLALEVPNCPYARDIAIFNAVDSLQFRTVFANVRPARIAVLVDESDPDWQVLCQGVIEYLSATWGGEHSLIIPSDGNAIQPVFWKLLETFDPDYVWRYQKTGRDFQRSNPTRFQEIVDREMVGRSEDGGDIDRLRVQVENALASSHFGNWGPTIELERELKARLAPFHFEDRVTHSIVAGLEPRYPVTPLATILPNCDHAQCVTTVRSSEAAVPQLWIEAVTGSVSKPLDQALRAQGVALREIELDGNFGELCEFVMNGRTDTLHREIASAMGGPYHGLALDHLTGTPFQLSMLGVSKYREKGYNDWNAPTITIIGSTVYDFALYFNLSRIREFVYWLPSEWIDGFERSADSGGYLRQFAQGLHAAESRGGQGNPVFASKSLSPDQIRSVIATLHAANYGIGNLQAAEVVDDVTCFITSPFWALNTDNFSIPITQQFLDGLGVGFFPTPKPKGFSSIVVYKHRWITELEIEGHAYPRHPALGEWLVRDTRLHTKSVRIGRLGPCYECPSSAHFGGDVDTILIRPRLYVPDAASVFQRLSNTNGWNAKLSDKGFFLQDTARKFGGLAQLASAIRNPRTKDVLWKFLQARPKGKKPPEAPVFLDSTNRWYLTFEHIKSTHVEQDAAVRLLDDLLTRNILHRGTILQCEFCRSADWYPMMDFGPSFTCARCRRDQRVTSKHAHQAEPGWYYQLDEVTYQGLRANMHVPVLALDYLRRTSSSFLYSEELEIWKHSEGPFKEIDICCICDGALTIGEAKIGNRIEGGGAKEIEALKKYVEVAQGLGAERFVLATENEWSPETLKNAQDTFSGSRVHVLPISAAELLG